MPTSEEYEQDSADCMVAAGNATENGAVVDAQLSVIGGVQQALLGILVELRRLNDGRDAFHREVLEVLTQAKEETWNVQEERQTPTRSARTRTTPEESPNSGRAAASACPEDSP